MISAFHNPTSSRPSLGQDLGGEYKLHQSQTRPKANGDNSISAKTQNHKSFHSDFELTWNAGGIWRTLMCLNLHHCLQIIKITKHRFFLSGLVDNNSSLPPQPQQEHRFSTETREDNIEDKPQCVKRKMSHVFPEIISVDLSRSHLLSGDKNYEDMIRNSNMQNGGLTTGTSLFAGIFAGFHGNHSRQFKSL